MIFEGEVWSQQAPNAASINPGSPMNRFEVLVKALNINLGEIEHHLGPEKYRVFLPLLERRLNNQLNGRAQRKEFNMLLKAAGEHRPIPGGRELESLYERYKNSEATPRTQLAEKKFIAQEKALEREEAMVSREDPSLNKPLSEPEQHVLSIVLSHEQQGRLSPMEIREFINILSEQFGNDKVKAQEITPEKLDLRNKLIEKAAGEFAVPMRAALFAAKSGGQSGREAVNFILEFIELLILHQKELQGQVIVVEGGHKYNRAALRQYEERIIIHLEKEPTSGEQRKLVTEYFEDLHRYWAHEAQMESVQSHQSTQLSHQQPMHEPVPMQESAPINEPVPMQESAPMAAPISEAPLAPISRESVGAPMSTQQEAPVINDLPVQSPGLSEIENLREKNVFNNPTYTAQLRPTSNQQLRNQEKRTLRQVESIAIGKYKLGDWVMGNNGAKIKPTIEDVKKNHELLLLTTIKKDPHLWDSLSESDQATVSSRITELESSQSSNMTKEAPLISIAPTRPTLFSEKVKQQNGIGTNNVLSSLAAATKLEPTSNSTDMEPAPSLIPTTHAGIAG